MNNPLKVLRLNIIGVGPGDPELITVKAVNAAINSKFIFYPDVCGGKSRVAYDIIKNAVRLSGAKELPEEMFLPLEVEMKRSNGRNGDLYYKNAIKIIEKLKEGTCSYITIGDPMFYSTYYGLHNAIEDIRSDNFLKSGYELDINIINGVSSLHYALGLIGKPYIIKNGAVFITVPIKKNSAEIEREIRFIADKYPRPQVIVFMKAGAYVKDILSAFKRMYAAALTEDRVKLYLIEKSKLVNDFAERDCLDFDYFSILIGVFV